MEAEKLVKWAKNIFLQIISNLAYTSNVPNFGHLEKSKISLLSLANVKEIDLRIKQIQFRSRLLMLAEKFCFFQGGQS